MVIDLKKDWPPVFRPRGLRPAGRKRARSSCRASRGARRDWRRSHSLTSLPMGQKLAGARFGQPHEMFDFQAVVEFGFLVRGERGGFLAFDEIPDALAGRIRGLEVNHFARTQRRDELDEFFVRSHAATLAPAAQRDKRLNCEPRDLTSNILVLIRPTMHDSLRGRNAQRWRAAVFLRTPRRSFKSNFALCADSRDPPAIIHRAGCVGGITVVLIGRELAANEQCGGRLPGAAAHPDRARAVTEVPISPSSVRPLSPRRPLQFEFVDGRDCWVKLHCHVG